MLTLLQVFEARTILQAIEVNDSAIRVLLSEEDTHVTRNKTSTTSHEDDVGSVRRSLHGRLRCKGRLGRGAREYEGVEYEGRS